jgi:hypothetical protein
MSPLVGQLLQQFVLPQLGNLILHPPTTDPKRSTPTVTISADVRKQIQDIETAVNKLVDKTNLIPTDPKAKLEKLTRTKTTTKKTTKDGEETSSDVLDK